MIDKKPLGSLSPHLICLIVVGIALSITLALSLIYLEKMIGMFETLNQRSVEQEQRISKIETDVMMLRSDAQVARSLDNQKNEGSHYPTTITFSSSAQPLEGQLEAFSGIGIKFLAKEGGLYIEKVLPGSPAQKAGLYQGDKIIDIDNVPVSSLTPPQIVGGIRGEKGSSLLLSYLPAGTMGPIRTVKIVREEIDLKKLETGDGQK